MILTVRINENDTRKVEFLRNQGVSVARVVRKAIRKVYDDVNLDMYSDILPFEDDID